MNIVLDTNILDTHIGKRSASLLALTSLAKREYIKIYIPHVAEEEFKSHKKDDIRQAINSVTKSLGELNKILWIPELGTRVRALGEELKALKNQGEYDPALEEWMADVGAETLYLSTDRSKEIIQSYFDGQPPFKNKKNKNDFPDAFIWQMVLEIAARVEKIHFITNDKGFKIETDDETINIYESLETFTQSAEVQSLLRSLEDDIKLENLDRIIEEESILMSLVIPESEKLLKTYIENVQIVRNDIGDNSEGYIIGYDDIESLEFDVRGIEYYGDSTFTIPFSFSINLEIETNINSSEYFLLNTQRLDISLHSGADEILSGYAEISYEKKYDFSGDMKIKIKDDLSKEISDSEIGDALTEVDVEIDYVEESE